jgi:hypothetical protein
MGRDQSRMVMGDYTLVRHPQWSLWTATRHDNVEIPSRLAGQFVDPEDFRRAAQRIHGETYSWDRIQHQRKIDLRKLAEAEQIGASND